jgi:1,4-dihydroxy-2-naphthoyl-CoA hydrolase
MANITFHGEIEFEVISAEADQVTSEMPIQPGILNPYGVVHAGAILWLADVTATILAMGSTEARIGMSGFPLAINLSANFAGNQKAGTLKAVSSFVKKGKTVSIVRTIVVGDNDNLIAEISTNHIASR